MDARINLSSATWSTTLDSIAIVVQKHWRDRKSSAEVKADEIISVIVDY